MERVIIALMLLLGLTRACFGQAHTGKERISRQNVVDPSACGASSPPSWCSGSDIGAWTNAAIADLGASGTIYIPDGEYNYARPSVYRRLSSRPSQSIAVAVPRS